MRAQELLRHVPVRNAILSARCQETLLNPGGIIKLQRTDRCNAMQLMHVIAASIGIALLLTLVSVVRFRRRCEIDALRGRDA